VLLGLAVDRGRLLGLSHLPPGGLLALVVCGALDLPALLKTVIIISAHFDAIFVVGTYRATTSWYFQPNSCPRRPTVQYLRPGFNLSTLRAWGTTTRFFLSYGGGIPSKVFKRSMAALPRAVLWGIMPRTVRQNILEGARKWKGPDEVSGAHATMFEPGVHTTTGGVETGLLAHESRVLHCGRRQYAIFLVLNSQARN
jgi:hypothetical protein